MGGKYMSRKYVIYQRVSTEEQAAEGYSLKAMRERCEHYIQSQEDAELVKIYEDAGYSGTLEPSKRPALSQLLTDLKSKKVAFDTVLIWKLDRLSRSLRDTMNLEHILRKANVTLESVTERVDTSSPSGKMFFATIASFGEFESAQIGERTFNAMRSKVAEIPLGGNPPIGYRRHNKNLIVDMKQAEAVRKIFRKFLEVKNYSKVASFLNNRNICTAQGKIWNHKSIRRVLSNPTYAGSIAWNKRKGRLRCSNPLEKWIVKEGRHEAIVSKRVFDKVQNILYQEG